jgi:predicted nicotinamide N-methyase
MNKLINNLQQRVPLSHVDLPEDVDAEVLLPVLEDISSINPHYVKQFLSQRLFKTGIDQDDYYELFSELIMSKPLLPTNADLIKYNISGIPVTIQETPRLISGSGTTGQRTWEAALYLSNWLLSSHKEELKDKRILELGTGTGLVSLSLLKSSVDYKRLIITDGDSALIDALSKNFALNNIKYPNPGISCHCLWWDQDPVPESDVIVAADVTYDSRIIPSLVSAIDDGLKTAREAFIAATVRSQETLQVFDDELTKKGLDWQVVQQCDKPWELDQEVWYPSTCAGMKIYRIRK